MKLVLMFLVLLASPAYAVNKCTMPDGRVVFQDAPCAAGRSETLNVRPASGFGRSAEVTASEAAGQGAPVEKPLTEAQRIERRIAESQKARRLQELEVRLVPDADGAVARQRNWCDNELKSLQAKKAQASNNLAGATWEGSISAEMTAVATRCDTLNRDLREDAARLRSECRSLGGCR